MSTPEPDTIETTIVVDADAADVVDAEETVAVFAAPDAVTAEVVRGALQGEGIDARIGEQVTDAYGGPFAVGEGFWGEVRVPASQVEAARTILAAFDAGQGAVTDAEITAEAEATSDPEV